MTQQEQIEHMDTTVQVIETATGKEMVGCGITGDGVYAEFPDDEGHRAAVRQGLDTDEVRMMGARMLRGHGSIVVMVPGGWR